MRLLPIRAMINSEKLHRRWMFHERGYESDPCCCCDIRDPFGYEKTRYRRADSTDNDYDHAALFSRSSLFFSLFLCGFTSGQHRDSRYLRRIHISDIFIDARPKKRSKRGSRWRARSGDWVERELNRVSFWTQMSDTIKFARARLRKFARAFNAFANWRTRPIWMLRQIQTATCFQLSKSGASNAGHFWKSRTDCYYLDVHKLNKSREICKFLRTKLIFIYYR